jgi:hypothetical protein
MKKGTHHNKKTHIKMSISQKKRYEKIEERQKSIENAKKRYIERPEIQQRQSESAKKRFGRSGEREKHSELMKIIHGTKEARQKQSEIQKVVQGTLSSRQNHSKKINAFYREHPEARKEMSVKIKNWYAEHPEAREKQSKFMKQFYSDHPETLEKIRESSITRFASKESRQKASDRTKKQYVDHKWYGDITYGERDKYCVLFNNEFKERCRAFYGYKSILSGEKATVKHFKTKKLINLTIHHVYYQKKACCEWDEDTQGYYAMINLGTKQNPKIIRHNIRGDPNKFVTLTFAENSMVNFDKIRWIKLFEEMIEKQGGKCYFTKQEMKEWKSNQNVKTLYTTSNKQITTQVEA